VTAALNKSQPAIVPVTCWLPQTPAFVTRQKRLLFVNKKQQKNVFSLGRAGFNVFGPVSKKFLRRFFQKAASFCDLKPSRSMVRCK
jgi:hypothetical protein